MTAFVAFAEYQFELDAPVEGQPLRTHLEAAYERSGLMPAKLADAPALPEGFELLWRDFSKLSARRGGPMGAELITHTEMDAYQRNHRFQFEAWEIDALERADVAFMAQQAKNRKAAGK